MTSRRFASLALFVGLPLLAPRAQADRIATVTATTSMGSGFGTSLADAVNGNGLSSLSLTALHDPSAPGNSWIASSGRVSGRVNFDFGDTYLLNGFSFWNENGSNSTTGIRTVTISTSLDGANFFPLAGSPGGFAKVLNAPAPPEIFTFTPVLARYVQFAIGSSWGNEQVGMAEVGFDGSLPSAVPEPSTLAMAAIGMIAVLLGCWRRPDRVRRNNHWPGVQQSLSAATFAIALCCCVPLQASSITPVVPGPPGSWTYEFGAHQTLQGGSGFPIPAHGSDNSSFTFGPNLSGALAIFDYSPSADTIFIGGWTTAVALLVQNTGEGFGATGQLNLSNLRYRIDPGPGENIGDPVTLYASLVAIEHGYARSRNLQAVVNYGLHATDPNGAGAGSTLILRGTQTDYLGQSIRTSNTVPFAMLIGDEVDLFVVSNGSANQFTSPYVNGQDFHFQLSFSPVPPGDPTVMFPSVPEPATGYLLALGGMVLVLIGKLNCRFSSGKSFLRRWAGLVH